MSIREQPIRFRFSPRKALAALHLMVDREGPVDLHTALKACYFADKAHLNEHGRPVFGATYRAMRYGPVPLEIYEMAKGEPLWLAELGVSGLPWELRGYRLHRAPGWNEAPDLRVFSASDRAAVEAGVQQSCALSFDERTAATHGPDWQAARLGIMRYEDMLAEGPDKEARIAWLREAAPALRI